MSLKSSSWQDWAQLLLPITLACLAIGLIKWLKIDVSETIDLIPI